MAKPSDSPHHIALYMPSLRGGGAERVMVILANALAARGHRVDLVLTRAEGPYLDEVADTVRIVDLDKGRVLASLPALVRYLRRGRPDAMLSALNHANIIAIVARRLAGVKTRLVVSEHTAPSRGLSSGGMSAIIRRLMRWFYPDADAIVCVSQGMRDEMLDLLGLPDKKLHRIYNPLDLDRIRAMKGAPVNHPWFSERSLPVLLAAGRLTEAKDYPTLLKAVATLNARRTVRLVILGQGEEEAALKAMTIELGLAEWVDFVGFQANPFAWMAACDAYVMSSKWEGLPGTLLEALACGAKIVSTDCQTGPDEILEGGKWGRLVPVGDTEALAQAMETALDAPTPQDIESAVGTFRVDHIIMQYEAQLISAG